MDAKPSGRLLTGHSSGGWAALWLQVTYPKLFGGAWPTSPDPSDFRDFLASTSTLPMLTSIASPIGRLGRWRASGV
jgi:enterochelin esterase-like enzyme